MTSLNLSADLIGRAQHDQDAFSLLYQNCFRATYFFMASRVNKPEIAEDLTSNLWLKVVEKLPRLRSTEPLVFQRWLFQIARHELIDFYRVQKREPLELNLESFDENTLAETMASAQWDDHRFLSLLIRMLPAIQAETISLKFFGELSNQEIAEILDVSEKTVASNCSRGLQKLATLYKKFEP